MKQRVYLLDDYADEKRDAWNKLGDRLEAILTGMASSHPYNEIAMPAPSPQSSG